MNEEKPWLAIYAFGNLEEQLDEDEYKAFCEAMDAEAYHVVLKDGRRLSTRLQVLTPNPRYISPKSIKRTRKKREYWNEFQHLKKEGVVKNKEEYIEWKKDKKNGEK